MLRGLEIRDMLIIDRLDLEFQPGLNVLTGETGAGKSILLDSLGFVLGWRGRAELVRAGAEQGEVTAVFQLGEDHPARAVLEEAGLPVSDELILRRINTRDGRKTAWVNDRRASGEVLRALSATLVELHGQQDDRGLLNPRGHRLLLDAYGELEPLVGRTRAAWRARSEAQKVLDAAALRMEALKSEEDYLRHAVAELDALAAQAGEEAALDTRRRLMQASEKIGADIRRAYDALGAEGAEGRTSDAIRWLEDAEGSAEGILDTPLESLSRALSELADAQAGIEHAIDALAFNPADLEETEERLFAIRALARKHSVMPDDLGPFADDLRGKLAALDGGAADLAGLKAALEQARKSYEDAAAKLSAARAKASKSLDKSMAGELAPLKMERAIFATEITPAEPGPEGTDMVAFTVATNPGAPSGPLNKIASGGELSRFLLALKVCLTRNNNGLSMIFDEIDRGVGGATADAVGRRLAALAEGAQVLVVTHSPQVAALAQHHWRVEKQTLKGATTSKVVPLDAAARADEIARMLSGDTVTTEARAAAKALMAG
ncbi:MAG: DNA repair protein RecN [Alphaproteobacteria bacterium]|nr:DNA repair protein RecN [Alphaproteobacteria bacterium]NNF24598.1 DNA repair protein RecN [Paracoccaceae bacterium]